MPAAIPLAKNAVTFSFCHTARSERTAMAIFVSKRICPGSPAARGGVLNAGARRLAGGPAYWLGEAGRAGGLGAVLAVAGWPIRSYARPFPRARLPPAQPRDLLARGDRVRGTGVHLPRRRARQHDRPGDGLQPRRSP